MKIAPIFNTFSKISSKNLNVFKFLLYFLQLWYSACTTMLSPPPFWLVGLAKYLKRNLKEMQSAIWSHSGVNFSTISFVNFFLNKSLTSGGIMFMSLSNSCKPIVKSSIPVGTFTQSWNAWTPPSTRSALMVWVAPDDGFAALAEVVTADLATSPWSCPAFALISPVELSPGHVACFASHASSVG